ncbi:MAG: DNA polymerase II [Deltaproteobacteria bacterium]|nr:MAG: DNA polymerase II [Deltaproteobacteria bacterium]
MTYAIMELKDMKGFILTSDSYDQGIPAGVNRHVTVFHGKGERGPFELRFTNNLPLFFVDRAADFQLAPGIERKQVDLKNFQGNAVDCLYFQTYDQLLKTRDDLASKGVRTFESDVRTPERFLMERFINGAVEVQGESTIENGKLVFNNPTIRKADYLPNLEICSLDIETSMGNDLFSIALHQYGNEEKKIVFMRGEPRPTELEYMKLFSSEKEVLLAFLQCLSEWDPDILIGWHVVGFDLAFLEKKCQQYGLELTIGRSRRAARIVERKGAGWFARLDGRVVVDGPQAMRAAFYSFENFKLQTVASEILGASKDIEATGMDKVEEIERRFREDKESLAKYNLLDCELVSEIYQKTGLIELITTRVTLSGMLMDRIGVSTAAFDHFFLPRLHRKGFVASNIIDIVREGHAAGGLVIDSVVGLHDNVAVLDFKSLYPSIIRTFKIDPYSRLMQDHNPVTTPAGLRFSGTEHILPDFIEELMEKRKNAKELGDAYLSQAIKILMNSFYGVMGSGGSRFYHADLPTAITGTGQWILRQAIDYLEGEGYEVLYGDTDSVFYKLKDTEVTRPFDMANLRAKRLNEYLSQMIKRQFKTESELDIEFEKYYKKLFLPPLRSGEGGAKKRYAGLLHTKKGEELSFAGMEVVRSDWTKMAKIFQTELFRRLFHGEDIEDFIRQFSNELKEGKFNDKLVYKKRLTKDISEYTKSVPPHVKAAKILDPDGTKNLRDIEYIITTRGPWPSEQNPTDIDYVHYLEKQVKPIADSVLSTMDRSFDNIVIGDQLSLF